jgi:hypothetical protein
MSILYLNPSAFKSPNLFNHSSVLALIGSCLHVKNHFYLAFVIHGVLFISLIIMLVPGVMLYRSDEATQ